MKEGKPNPFLRFLIAFFSGAAAGVLIALLRGLGGGKTAQQNAALLSDGFFVAGVMLAGVGALLLISGKTDFFDMFAYGFKSLAVLFTPFKNPGKHPRFYEYKKQRQEKRKAPPPFLLFAGLALILAAALLLPFCGL
ncbi:MAG: DUF3899 domain-containing protein [Clostridia bacterium]|nr:DUF3899 domain-containing protein [Clostridia bacterium]